MIGFSGAEEFRWGDDVEVRNKDNKKWLPAIYIGLHPKDRYYKYVVLDEHGDLSSWKYRRKVRPNLKVDDKVMVRAVGVDQWLHGHFKEWPEGDGIICFDGGRTSWTSEGKHIHWKCWKLP